MINSQVKYLNSIGELLKLDFSNNTDYILKDKFPIKYEIFKDLLEVEMKDSSYMENVFIEFERISLSGRQILNLCNNLNVNLLIREVSDEQMEELLINYSIMDMRKTVYPAKVIVLLSLFALYLYHFKGYDFFENMDSFVEKVFEKYISFTYISDKYDKQFLLDWTKFYIKYLIDNHKDFVGNLKQHCLYLFNIAYKYYKPETIDLPPKQSNLKSGIAIPLAFVMRDLRFNPFKVKYDATIEYDYVPKLFHGMIIKALMPIVDYVIASENYINSKEKTTVEVENLKTLNKEDIFRFLKNKNILKTKNPTSEVDLFPLEVISE